MSTHTSPNNNTVHNIRLTGTTQYRKTLPHHGQSQRHQPMRETLHKHTPQPPHTQEPETEHPTPHRGKLAPQQGATRNGCRPGPWGPGATEDSSAVSNPNSTRRVKPMISQARVFRKLRAVVHCSGPCGHGKGVAKRGAACWVLELSPASGRSANSGTSRP